MYNKDYMNTVWGWGKGRQIMTTKINVDSRTILERLRVRQVSPGSRAIEYIHHLKTKRRNKQKRKKEEKEQVTKEK